MTPTCNGKHRRYTVHTRTEPASAPARLAHTPTFIIDTVVSSVPYRTYHVRVNLIQLAGTAVHRARLTTPMYAAAGSCRALASAARALSHPRPCVRVQSVLASGYHRATGSSGRLRRCFRCLCSGSSSLELTQHGGTVADLVSREVSSSLHIYVVWTRALLQHILCPRQASDPHNFPSAGVRYVLSSLGASQDLSERSVARYRKSRTWTRQCIPPHGTRRA